MPAIDEGDTVSIKFTSGEEIIARFVSDDGAVVNLSLIHISEPTRP